MLHYGQSSSFTILIMSSLTEEGRSLIVALICRFLVISDVQQIVGLLNFIPGKVFAHLKQYICFLANKLCSLCFGY